MSNGTKALIWLWVAVVAVTLAIIFNHPWPMPTFVAALTLSVIYLCMEIP